MQASRPGNCPAGPDSETGFFSVIKRFFPKQTVPLRNGKQCCESRVFIPDPGTELFHHGSRIQIRIK
jgi:hypothetical protein